MEGKMLVEGMHKKSRPITWYTSQTKRGDGENYMTTAFFSLPQAPADRVAIGGASFRSELPQANFLPANS